MTVTRSAKKTSSLRVAWSWVYPMAIGVAIALSFQKWVATAALVPSQSMNPTIPAPCHIFVNRLSTEFANPFRGEVVLFHYPDNPSEIFVKRIIGMPGDTVTITNTAVYINGKLLKEPYIDQPNVSGLGTYHVPAGHYFMMGDNRSNSLDSRFWVHKYVARSAIVGQADFVVFPLNKIEGIVQ